jgi:hypothetical protein
MFGRTVEFITANGTTTKCKGRVSSLGPMAASMKVST